MVLSNLKRVEAALLVKPPKIFKHLEFTLKIKQTI